MLEQLRDYLKKENVFILIGIPAYGGNVQTGFTQSILRLQKLFVENGVRHEFSFIAGESLISRARNSIFSNFQSNKEYTHLFFIDSDITFREESVIHLLLSNLELCGVSYPKKELNWERIKHLIKGNAKDIDLFNSMSDMNYNLVYNSNEKGHYVKMVGSFVESKDIPTGFMLIKRIVANLLTLNYPERQYTNNVSGYGKNKTFYDFFAVGVVDGVYLSEDYYFCRLCRDIGITLYLDTESTLVHTGQLDFVGCLGNFLKNDSFNKDNQLLN